MTDAQLTAILGVLGSLGAAFLAAVRWAVNRLTKALDDNTESNREASRAQVTHATSLATLSTKIDTVHDWVHAHPTPPPAPMPSMAERFARLDADAAPAPPISPLLDTSRRHRAIVHHEREVTPTENQRYPNTRRRKGAI